jgi:[protein-PII] uridylyltransferase
MLAHSLTDLALLPITVPAYKQAIAAFTEESAEQFTKGAEVVDLIQARAHFIDALLQNVWADRMPAHASATLIAVGGYGRGELHPASDIDLLILLENNPASLTEPIESLLTFLWDIGLQIGHSVRSLAECVALARSDVTVITNLLESRFLAGQTHLLTALHTQTNTTQMWSSAAFFAAKLEEQHQRHAKVDDSAYDLEPNIKLNPGGLRDIQIIGWVAKRHFKTQSLADLLSLGFLSEVEYKSLRGGEKFLWRIRYALHRLTGRHEDRLLFEHQRTLAQQFGYTDSNINLAVEQFMQSYYRTVIRLQRLNELLLQLFQEAILQVDLPSKPQPINQRFQARHGYLEVINPDIFRQRPLTLLELFLVLQQNPDLQGVRANTIRAVRLHRDCINAALRADIRARSLFMEILRQPAGITQALRRMHRYGILSRYIPAFHQITGLMQFDLFHRYTVDEHSLMVLRNIRRFALPKHRDECAAFHQVWPEVAKPEWLYLAALFHDIGKGRDGNHSKLGAIDAFDFCQQHGLSKHDCELVAWLVKRHLFMSRVAQQQDIDDDDVVRIFAKQIPSLQHLHSLYLLTAADMQGTNPARWNSWKSALLTRLYQRTRHLLQQHEEAIMDTQQRIEQVQQAAQKQLTNRPYTTEQITACWTTCSADYFLQTSSETIAWHTEKYLQPELISSQIHVFIREDLQRGCSEIFSFGPDRDGLFAETTAAFDQLALNIFGARIEVRGTNQAVSSYYVLDNEGQAISADRHTEIIHYLTHHLNHPSKSRSSRINPSISRRLQNFVCDTQVCFTNTIDQTTTQFELTTHDRPGLLSQIGTLLDEYQLRVHSAQIMTEGAIAQDRFTCTDRHNQPISDHHLLATLEQRLISALND